MRKYIDVAYLAKSKNRNGRFVVKSTAGLPFLLEPGDEVALVPPRTDLPRDVRVASVEDAGEGEAVVAFDGVSSDDAREMVGMHCLIRRDLVDEEALAAAPGLWQGWAVVDGASGQVGHVAGLVENPAQDLLEVARPDGTTVLVPLVDEIVRDVDPDSATVLVSLPQGLLDL